MYLPMIVWQTHVLDTYGCMMYDTVLRTIQADGEAAEKGRRRRGPGLRGRGPRPLARLDSLLVRHDLQSHTMESYCPRAQDRPGTFCIHFFLVGRGPAVHLRPRPAATLGRHVNGLLAGAGPIKHDTSTPAAWRIAMPCSSPFSSSSCRFSFPPPQRAGHPGLPGQ